MTPLTLAEFARIVEGRIEGDGSEAVVTRIDVDSRRAAPGGVFFALPGARVDGTRFVRDAFEQGHVAAVVGARADVERGLSPLVRVESPLAALRRFAAYWRGRSPGLWVGVAGSAGKTTTKDFLVAALAAAVKVAASPGSFNSQLGVALSALSVGLDAEIAVLEAGISGPGQMRPLADMLRPDVGVFTGIGETHRAAFPDRLALLDEKMELFGNLRPDAGWLLVDRHVPDDDLARIRQRCPAPAHRLGDDDPAGVWPRSRVVDAGDGSGELAVALDFPDRPGGEKTVRLATRSLRLAAAAELALTAAGRLDGSLFPLRNLAACVPGSTRMEMWRSPLGVTLASDACGDDRLSVEQACQTLARLRRPGKRCVLVLGVRPARAARRPPAEPEAPFAAGAAPIGGEEAVELAREAGIDRLVVVARPAAGAGAGRVGGEEAVELAREAGIDRLVVVARPAAGTAGGKAASGAGARKTPRPGKRRAKVLAAGSPEIAWCASAAEAAEGLRPWLREGDAALFRGRPGDGLSEAAELLLERPAVNRLFVDLRAVAENIARFRRLTGPNVKLLGMVKALGYGSHLGDLGRELTRLGLDWLGVSTPDEGTQLRRAGVDAPILAMLCPPGEADKAVRHRLAVALYSFELADALAAAARRAGDPRIGAPVEVHLKIDSGMGRLGVRPEDAVALARRAAEAGLRVSGVLTHFARADEPEADDATRGQIRRFDDALSRLAEAGFGGLARHAAATAGAARFPEAHYDMIRIGLGLYGWQPSAATASACPLAPAAALTSRLVVLGERRAGDRIGYGGAFEVPMDGFRMGVVPMGYHDGLPWGVAGRGARIGVRGRLAPLVGRVSMDSAAVDLSGVPDAVVGDDALIWGARDGMRIDPGDWAALAGTTVYEILARLGPRVQRVFAGD